MSIMRILFARAPAPLLRLVPPALREKWLPLPRRNELQIREALRGGTRVVFVSSYPRSGNTWLRKLMADLILQQNGEETGTSLPVHQDRLIPDREFNSIGEELPVERMPGLAVKTHDPWPEVSRLCPAGGRGEVRHLYIWRDPSDTLVSYYHFHLRYEDLKAKLGGQGIDDFCLERLPGWKEHLESYLRAMERGEPVLLASYERLSADPVPLLLALFEALDFPVTRAQAESAVEHQRFRKLKQKEAEDPMNEQEFFFRKGKVGSAGEELRPDTLRAIARETGGLVERADALMEEQIESQET